MGFVKLIQILMVSNRMYTHIKCFTLKIALSDRKKSLSAAEETRARIHSNYMREMTCGKFIVKSSLLGTIGEGKAHSLKKLKINMCFCSFIGEFGIVYRARQGNSSKVVAVKTLKGLLTYLYECTFRPKMGLKNLANCGYIFYVGDFHKVEVDRFVEESLKNESI